MNWSNGQLARHSRRSYKKDATRQKQYFAQAKRRKITDDHRKTYDAANFVPSYLQDSQPEPKPKTPNTLPQKEKRSRLLTLPAASTGPVNPAEQEQTSHGITQINPIYTEEDTTVLDAKRRKLLQLSDWSGMELQKPVIIQYPESSKSRTKARIRIQTLPRDTYSRQEERIEKQLPQDAFIKIASQEYRWSPENNSVRTRHSKISNNPLETPASIRGSWDRTSSSTSQSFSSFVTESPCAERSLLLRRQLAAGKSTLHSRTQTSPSIFDDLAAKIVPETQYFHPQPIRIMPPRIFSQLADSANNDHILMTFAGLEPQTDGPAVECSLRIAKSKSGDSIIAETANDTSSSKISESHSPRLSQAFSILQGPSPLGRKLGRQYSRAESPRSTDAESPDAQIPLCSIGSSITSPDIYKTAEVTHSGSRLHVPPYRHPVVTGLELGEDENIMWKRFVFGPANVGGVGSAEHSQTDIPDGSGTDNRAKLGVEHSVLEPPTRIASKLEHTSSPPITRRHPGPTPAPTKPTPSPTISVEDPYLIASASKPNNHPQNVVSDDAAPVYFRDRAAPAAFSTEQNDDASQPATIETQHMTSKTESMFHPPSLFVGRLAANSARAAVAVPCSSKTHDSGSGAIRGAATTVQMPGLAIKKRRSKKREAGRPDIRALPNIQGDPIEFTP